MKILLVDDHVLFREGVASLLEEQPDITILGEAASVQGAIEKARALKPDIILMDISLPDGTGLDAARQILAEQPDINIVFLTVHEEDDTLFQAIKIGGKGYLLKNIRTTDLLEMLRGLARGEAALSRQLTSRILAEFSRVYEQLDKVGAPGPDVHLTRRETEVLKLVATNATNQEIAAALFVSVSTVKNHVRNILSKLHLKNRQEAANFARRHGLLKSSPNDT